MPARLVRLIAAVALLLLAGSVSARAEERHLRQWVDKNGVTHLTIGPSPKARERASQVSLEPRATNKKAKVHETSDWDESIQEAAERYKIPPELVRAIIVAESNFDPMALSPVGARGLMQLMPGTAAEMYVSDAHDPVQNIHGGTRYLRILANMFGGDIIKTVAAYNAGPDAVRRNNGVPPYAETQGYVRRVIKLYRIYKGLDG